MPLVSSLASIASMVDFPAFVKPRATIAYSGLAGADLWQHCEKGTEEVLLIGSIAILTACSNKDES